MLPDFEIQPTRTVPGFSLLKKDDSNPYFSSTDVLCSMPSEYLPDGTPVWGRTRAMSEANRNRLVKAPQCPTPEKKAELDQFRAARDHENKKRSDNHALWTLLREQQHDAIESMPDGKEKTAAQKAFDRSIATSKYDLLPENFGEVINLRGSNYELADLMTTGELTPTKRKSEGGDCAFTVISHREWSDEWRIRTQVDQCSAKPPGHEGDRITTALTLAGARKIADSCQYMHLKHGGYRTFLTLTFDTPGRSRVEIRKADAPFTELNTEKLGQMVITKGVVLDGPEKREGIWFPGRRLWHDEKLMPDAPEGDFCPVQQINGQYYAAATGDAGADVTFNSIQKEVGRFFDAANKMRQRGWKATKQYPWGRLDCIERGTETRRYPWGMVECMTPEQLVGEKPSEVIGIKTKKAKRRKYKNGHAVECIESEMGYLADKKINIQRQPVRYCWVVENPLNERGQRNPHIHILMDWRVRFSAFASWAYRLESIWGQGFATLEKIKDTEVAGAYMAKAAGYISKSQGDNKQGPVKGNRYGISTRSRAPEWVCAGRYELGIMGSLIADTHDYFTALYGGHFARRKQLKTALDDVPKNHKGMRQRIGRTLEKVRSALNRLPAVASKYQLLIKSTERFEEFKAWATGREQHNGNAWLPPKAQGDAWNPAEQKPDGNWFKEFKFRMHCERVNRRFMGIPLGIYTDDYNAEERRKTKQAAALSLDDWLSYSGLNWKPEY